MWILRFRRSQQRLWLACLSFLSFLSFFGHPSKQASDHSNEESMGTLLCAAGMHETRQSEHFLLSHSPATPTSHPTSQPTNGKKKNKQQTTCLFVFIFPFDPEQPTTNLFFSPLSRNTPGLSLFVVPHYCRPLLPATRKVLQHFH